MDGPGSNPLHAVIEDLRHGRPAVLEGYGPRNRPPSDVDDPNRSVDSRHLPVRPRRRSAGGYLPDLFLDVRRAEDAAAAGGEARRIGFVGATENLSEGGS